MIPIASGFQDEFQKQVKQKGFTQSLTKRCHKRNTIPFPPAKIYPSAGGHIWLSEEFKIPQIPYTSTLTYSILLKLPSYNDDVKRAYEAISMPFSSRALPNDLPHHYQVRTSSLGTIVALHFQMLPTLDSYSIFL